MSITLNGTTGIIADNPATVKANAFLDAAGGNTATINGAIPAPATSPTLTTPIISGNLGAGGANYGTSGQVLTSGGTGASPSWATIVTGGMTLLGTLTTTSGTTQTLSSLTLTSYAFIVAVFKDVSSSSTSSLRLNSISGEQLSASGGVTLGVSGIMWLHLATGVLSSATVSATPGNGAGPISPYTGYQSTITTASTSIVFAQGVGNFDAGTITVYGVK